MIAYVQQQRPTFCFLACVESFLAENGQLISQGEILKRAADVLGANENDLGAFAAANFGRIDKEFGLETRQVTAVNNQMPRTESVFALTKWAGRDDSIHWVRVLKIDAKDCLLMNPAHEHCPHRVDTPSLTNWIIALFLVRFIASPR